jgi:hypothetical protein
VPATDSCVLVFSCLGYNKTKRIAPTTAGDMTINVRMRRLDFVLDAITVTARQSSGTMEMIPTDRSRLNVDATGGSVESIVITAGMGVSSTNELSAQYSVRGGNYNENIVYVNGIEVYRPILIRSGQQEGLSFINPDLTAKVAFSSGGFEARYGDKMSSVLDVTYKKPDRFEGGVAGSMLGGNVYLGNSAGKFTQITGFRYKRGTTLLNMLDTKGDYNPTAIDMQTYMTYALAPRLSLSFLGNYSDNTYDFNPTNRETSFGTMDEPKKFTVYYDGAERDRFKILFGAATLKYEIAEHADIAVQASAFQSTEQENYDIAGEYWLSNSLPEGEKEVIGTGRVLNHARNYLETNVMSIAVNGGAGFNQHTVRWSLACQREKTSDRIKEWELRDSMGYSLPHNEETLQVYSNLSSKNNIVSGRFSGYLQDTYRFRVRDGLFSITAGIRGSYWNFNREFIFSPRASIRFIPSRNENFIFRLATGIYYQTPFYKEFRTVNGSLSNRYVELNRNIKSQRSVHFVLGGDYKFKFDGRPFKMKTELYYKKMDDLVPYTVNNVRIDYSGENSSYGYATGIDMKLFGQFVPGNDSWIGLSLMEAKQYIGGKKVPMPTDQLYNFTFYFTDYAPYVPDRRVQLNLRIIWAGGFPFSVPGGQYKYIQSIRTRPYNRVDIGMSYRLSDENNFRANAGSFWQNFKNVWIGADVFNLFDIGNVSSYSWFADTGGILYAVPDRLTGRQLNIKLVAEF